MNENQVENQFENQNQVENQEEVQLDPIIEKEARNNGWVPKENYKGDPEDWMDAPAFVKKGREINPILRKNNERLQKDLDAAKRELEEVKLTTKQFAEEFSKMRENAYKRALTELKEQRKEATKEDDLDLVDEINDRIEILKQEQANKSEQAKKTELKEQPKPDMTIFNEWHQDNEWFDQKKNPELFEIAEEVAIRLNLQKSGLIGRSFLDKVTEIVKERHPEKFQNPKRNTSTYSGSGSRGQSKSKTYSDLPQAAKDKCDKFVKSGILTREKYVELYEWD
jgi:hypothetical protein